MPTHQSGMPRICGPISLQGLQNAGHDKGQTAKRHPVGHRRSRSGVEMVVDQEGRGVACRGALHGHKLGLDQSQLGRLGEGV